jgi:hypothetical protein
MTRTEELLKLAEAATPGPWGVVEDAASGKDEAWCLWHKVGPIWFQGEKPDRNSTFIAAANPELIKQLVELVRLQHEALKQYYSDFKLGGEALAAFEKFDKGGE